MEKKKRSIKMIILFIIVVLAAIFLIHIFRNYSILKKISEKQDILQKSTNYSYTIEGNLNENTTTERYYKDGKSVEVLKMKDTTIITWKDKYEGEKIRLFPNLLKADVMEYEVPFDNMDIPYLITNDSAMALSLVSFITSQKLDGRDCYVINLKGEIMYIDKENGAILKAIGKNVEVEYKNWKFNEVTERDVARPNLTGYEIEE